MSGVTLWELQVIPVPTQKTHKQKRRSMSGVFVNMERETRLELATPTLARSCSTN